MVASWKDAPADLERLHSMDVGLNERIDAMKSMGDWWAHVRDEVIALNIGPRNLEEARISPQQLDALRTHWNAMDKELRERSVSLRKAPEYTEVSCVGRQELVERSKKYLTWNDLEIDHTPQVAVTTVT
jgi:hypothetical protein